MLIISLVLIALVCISVTLHLILRRRRRRRKPAGKKRKDEKKGGQQELASEGKKEVVGNVAELVGTPMCEIGESEVRHEMEDVEVDERHLAVGGAECERSSCHKSDVESEGVGDGDGDLEAGVSWYDDSEERVEPSERDLAMYWARAM